MKRTKPYRFDPISEMSYQEARRLRRLNRKLRKAIRRRSNEEDDSDIVVLENDLPKPKHWDGDKPKNIRQTVLLSGKKDNRTFSRLTAR